MEEKKLILGISPVNGEWTGFIWKDGLLIPVIDGEENFYACPTESDCVKLLPPDHGKTALAHRLAASPIFDNIYELESNALVRLLRALDMAQYIINQGDNVQKNCKLYGWLTEEYNTSWDVHRQYILDTMWSKCIKLSQLPETEQAVALANAAKNEAKLKQEERIKELQTELEKLQKMN